MKISIVGTSKTIHHYIRDINQYKWNIHFYLLDGYNEEDIYRNVNKGELENYFFHQNNLKNFLIQSPVIIIDIVEKKHLYQMIKSWSTFHSKGLLILRNSVELGTGDRIYDWLNRKGKRIEVINFPSMVPYSMEQSGRTLILGCDPYSTYTMQFRKALADRDSNTSVFLISRKEAELLLYTSQAFLLLKKAFWIEQEKVCTQLEIDVKVIQKGLTSYMDNNLHNQIISEDFLKTINPVNMSRSYKYLRLVQYAKEIVKKDKLWIIYQLQHFIKKRAVKNIAVWGEDENIINRLLLLPIERIQIIKDKNRKLHHTKLVSYSNPYLAAKNADVLLLLNNQERYVTISLHKLEKVMLKKIIIDQANLFEQAEMEALHWNYISKGRPSIIN